MRGDTALCPHHISPSNHPLQTTAHLMSQPKASNQLALVFKLVPRADVARAAEIEAAGTVGAKSTEFCQAEC